MPPWCLLWRSSILCHDTRGQIWMDDAWQGEARWKPLKNQRKKVEPQWTKFWKNIAGLMSQDRQWPQFGVFTHFPLPFAFWNDPETFEEREQKQLSVIMVWALQVSVLLDFELMFLISKHKTTNQSIKQAKKQTKQYKTYQPSTKPIKPKYFKTIMQFAFWGWTCERWFHGPATKL